jgi:glycosyltransferase involved in cell wall biosynthesis
VVAFDSGGISETVRHSRTGFLAAEGDWQTLGKYLLVLLQDAKLREGFGIAGREWVLQEFALERRTKVLEEIYARVSGIDAAPKEDAYGPILQSSPTRGSHLSAGA